jgi:signal transduction histidine kinase
MNPQLLITLGGNGFFVILMLIMGAAVLFNNHRKGENVLFFAMCSSIALFMIGFIVAPLMPTYELSYKAWLFNLVDVFITTSVVHFILRVINKHKEYHWYIVMTYTMAAVILFVGILAPHIFLPTVLPKLYFPFYLEAGPWYTVMLVFFMGFPLLPFTELVKAYLTGSGTDRTRAEYFIIMLAFGYTFGPIDFFLVYDIELDPFFGMFLGLYLIPVAYGIVERDLLDIRIVLWRAVLFAVGIAVVSGFLTVLIFLNARIVEFFPFFEYWTITLIASTLAFMIGRYVWAKLQESERLKFEFVTVAAHKLRTPLTRIRWQLESLLMNAKTPEMLEGVKHIEHANNQLIELTNLLLDAAHTEDTSYKYQWKRVDIMQIVKEASGRFHIAAKEKDITLTIDGPSLYIQADTARLVSSIEVLVENAINYTPKGGQVQVTVHEDRGKAVLAVRDTGIGISRDDQSRIFSKFFRSDDAKLTDTEGVGLGLAITKNVVEKHRGRIWVESEGKNKGTSFFLAFPIDY